MMDKWAFRMWAVLLAFSYAVDMLIRSVTPTSAWYETAFGVVSIFFAISFAVSAWRRA